MIQIFSKKEIVDIIKRVTYLKESCLLTKGVSKTIESGFIEEPKGGFTGVLIVHWVLVYQQNSQQVKKLHELAEEQIEQGNSFNSTSSFN